MNSSRSERPSREAARRAGQPILVASAVVAVVIAFAAFGATIQLAGCTGPKDQIELGQPYTGTLRREPGDGSNIQLELHLAAGRGAYHVEAEATGTVSIDFYASSSEWLGSASLLTGLKGEADLILPDQCPVLVRLGGEEGRRTFTFTITPSQLPALDQAEPNEEIGAATMLSLETPPFQSPGLAIAGAEGVIAPGDTDWFALDLEAGVYSVARSLHGDARVALANPDGVALTASSWQDLRTGRYFVRVLPSEYGAYIVRYRFAVLRAPAGREGAAVDLWELLGLEAATRIGVGTLQGPNRWLDSASLVQLREAFQEAALPPGQAALIGDAGEIWPGTFLYVEGVRTPNLKVRGNLVNVQATSTGQWTVDANSVFQLSADLGALLGP